MASLRELDPMFLPYAQKLYDLAKSLDGSFVVTSARRSYLDQLRLWKRFQAGESLLPVAKPGTSMHELGLAVDIARLNVNPLEDDLLDQLGAAWEKAGGRWGGSFNHADPVHFEVPKVALQEASRAGAARIVEGHRRIDRAVYDYLKNAAESYLGLGGGSDDDDDDDDDET